VLGRIFAIKRKKQYEVGERCIMNSIICIFNQLNLKLAKESEICSSCTVTSQR
jgi:hypothetical protein